VRPAGGGGQLAVGQLGGGVLAGMPAAQVAQQRGEILGGPHVGGALGQPTGVGRSGGMYTGVDA